MNAVVELNRFAYEPLDVGSLSLDRTSLSKNTCQPSLADRLFFFRCKAAP